MFQPIIVLEATTLKDTERPPSKPILRPVGCKSFASEMAAASKTRKVNKPVSWAESAISGVSEGDGAWNVKTKAMKEGIKKVTVSTSLVVAGARGPTRPGEHPEIHHEDTFESVSKGGNRASKAFHSAKAEQDLNSPATDTSSPRGEVHA